MEDLLQEVARGKVRVPAFQRPPRWRHDEVRQLFDSIYRGYPIGALLLWKHDAPAARLKLGPLEMNAPETRDAFWVIDGQQRVTALAGVLLHPTPFKRPDMFTLYFDLNSEEFVFPGRVRPAAHLLPMSEVVDSERLQSWLDAYPGRKDNPSHFAAATRMARAVRQFEIPAYIVEAPSEDALREIFARLNTTGKGMKSVEVFQALYGAVGGPQPSDLHELAQSVMELGFGAPDERWLLKAILAVSGAEDLTRDFRLTIRGASDLKTVLAPTARALRDAVQFLREDALVPHIDLLPYAFPMVVLTRYFSRFPAPEARNRDLLGRWYWRGTLAGVHSGTVTEVRATLRAINSASNEDEAVQALLARVPASAVGPAPLDPFDSRSARTRVQLAALWALAPRHLITGAPLSSEQVFGHTRSPVIPLLSASTVPPEVSTQGLSNLILHPMLPGLRPGPELARRLPSAPVLGSHGIDMQAFDALCHGDHTRFLELRASTLESTVESFVNARARWNMSDRPRILALLSDEEDA